MSDLTDFPSRPNEDQVRFIGRLRDRAELANKNYRDYVAGLLWAGATPSRMSEVTGVSEETLEHWIAFPGTVPVCQNCGNDWHPVRRGECGKCGSDAGPATRGRP